MSQIFEPTDPFAKSQKSLYGDAMEGLLKPIPSTQFRRFEKLNIMTGGLRPYEFTILCGATGTGKTTLCANLSRDFVEQGIPHFVASVETGPTDFVRRIISAMVEKDWNTGDAIPLELVKSFHKEYGHYFQSETLMLSLYESRFSVETLISDIKWMIETHGIKLAIIDNLNFFLDATSAENVNIEMDRVVHELIMFCKETPIHVIMVMHPKKTFNGRVESEFDIKGSSTAVQEAHNIFLFNRPHPQHLDNGLADPQDRELFLAKMRRRGKFVQHRLLLKSTNCVSYSEKVIL